MGSLNAHPVGTSFPGLQEIEAMLTPTHTVAREARDHGYLVALPKESV